MHTSKYLAKGLKDLYFGGNWTAVNFADVLADVTWEDATTKIDDLNTIAILVYHSQYYIAEATKFFEGGPLEAKDAYSFKHPTINSEKDWKNMLQETRKVVEVFASLIEKFSNEQLEADFYDPKYGTVYRNISGYIEHCHYHLGQIVLLKKLIKNKA